MMCGVWFGIIIFSNWKWSICFPVGSINARRWLEVLFHMQKIDDCCLSIFRPWWIGSLKIHLFLAWIFMMEPLLHVILLMIFTFPLMRNNQGRIHLLFDSWNWLFFSITRNWRNLMESWKKCPPFLHEFVHWFFCNQ